MKDHQEKKMTEDDVLRRMLATPPAPHIPVKKPAKKPAKKST